MVVVVADFFRPLECGHLLPLFFSAKLLSALLERGTGKMLTWSSPLFFAAEWLSRLRSTLLARLVSALIDKTNSSEVCEMESVIRDVRDIKPEERHVFETLIGHNLAWVLLVHDDEQLAEERDDLVTVRMLERVDFGRLLRVVDDRNGWQVPPDFLPRKFRAPGNRHGRLLIAAFGTPIQSHSHWTSTTPLLS